MLTFSPKNNKQRNKATKESKRTHLKQRLTPLLDFIQRQHRSLLTLLPIIAIHVDIIVPVIISRGETVWVEVEQLFVVFLEVFVELGVFFGEFG